MYSGVFCAHRRQLSEITPNFGRFLPSQILLGGTLPKVVGYTPYHACLAPRRLVKFRKVTPANREIIGTHMLN